MEEFGTLCGVKVKKQFQERKRGGILSMRTCAVHFKLENSGRVWNFRTIFQIIFETIFLASLERGGEYS